VPLKKLRPCKNLHTNESDYSAKEGSSVKQNVFISGRNLHQGKPLFGVVTGSITTKQHLFQWKK